MGLKSVLIADSLDPVCSEILKCNGINVTTKTGLSKEDLLKEIEGYEGLIVRSSTQVTEDVIQAGKELKIVGRAGTGVDNIDAVAATRSGVLVMNTPGGNTLSAAEHTCALIIGLSKHLAQACASLKNGKWDRKNFQGEELNGKVLGVIGLGRVGREVAIRMQAFGMRTIGYDPVISSEIAAEFGVESMELNGIWPLADYITLHVPLIPQTKDLINTEVLGKCKKGVKIINVARGGILSEKSLLEGLKSGQVGGAALDVFEEEPPTKSKEAHVKELLEHPKLIATPHLGASTAEAQFRVAKEIAEQFLDVAFGRPLVGLVNAPSLAVSMTPSMKPWVELAEALGKIAAGLLQSDGHLPVEVNCILHGKEEPGQLLFLTTSSALLGFMKQASHRKISSSLNLVNVPLIAEEEGIKYTEFAHAEKPKKYEWADYILDVVLKTINDGDHIVKVSGTVKSSCPVLLEINNGNFESGVDLKGHVAFFSGSTAGIGSIMGEIENVTSVHKSAGGSKDFLAVKTSTEIKPPSPSKSGLKLVAALQF